MDNKAKIAEETINLDEAFFLFPFTRVYSLLYYS